MDANALILVLWHSSGWLPNIPGAPLPWRSLVLLAAARAPPTSLASLLSATTAASTCLSRGLTHHTVTVGTVLAASVAWTCPRCRAPLVPVATAHPALWRSATAGGGASTTGLTVDALVAAAWAAPPMCRTGCPLWRYWADTDDATTQSTPALVQGLVPGETASAATGMRAACTTRVVAENPPDAWPRFICQASFSCSDGTAEARVF